MKTLFLAMVVLLQYGCLGNRITSDIAEAKAKALELATKAAAEKEAQDITAETLMWVGVSCTGIGAAALFWMIISLAFMQTFRVKMLIAAGVMLASGSALVHASAHWTLILIAIIVAVLGWFGYKNRDKLGDLMDGRDKAEGDKGYG